MKSISLAVIGIILIAVLYEAYPPLGISLAAIALVSMFTGANIL